MPSVKSTVVSTAYSVLGVHPASTPAECQQAYTALAKMHHPDAGGDPNEFVRVGIAWSLIKFPQTRQSYDAMLRQTYDSCATCGGRGLTYKQVRMGVRKGMVCSKCCGVGYFCRA